MREIGMYTFIFSIIYLLIVILVLSLRHSWEIIREYRSIRNRGYFSEHQEKESKDNIYHSRLTGKVKRKRAMSLDARNILDDITKEDTHIDEDVIIEEDIIEETLPDYMIEKPVMLENSPNMDEEVKVPKKEAKSTGVLKLNLIEQEESDRTEKNTGVLKNSENVSKGPGILKNKEGTGALNQKDETGLLENPEKKEADVSEDDISNTEKSKGTGILQRNQTGVLKREGTGVLKNDNTGLLKREGTGLLKREGTGVLNLSEVFGKE